LRVKRVGTRFTSYFSYDGVTWVEQADAGLDLPKLGGTVLVGFANQNDTGFGVPPNDTYAGNGTTDAAGNPTQNESNYGVLRISHFGDYSSTIVPPTVSIRVEGTNVVITYTGTLQSSDSLTGNYAPVSGTSPLRLPLGSGAVTRFYRARN
jgi:hypothetical protein